MKECVWVLYIHNNNSLHSVSWSTEYILNFHNKAWIHRIKTYEQITEINWIDANTHVFMKEKRNKKNNNNEKNLFERHWQQTKSFLLHQLLLLPTNIHTICFFLHFLIVESYNVNWTHIEKRRLKSTIEIIFQ